MPWTFKQSSGELFHNGSLIGRGFSGAGAGRNNPGMQTLPNGPIPAGKYVIAYANVEYDREQITMDISPFGHTAQGRNAMTLRQESDDGQSLFDCIVLDHRTLAVMETSGDFELIVSR